MPRTWIRGSCSATSRSNLSWAGCGSTPRTDSPLLCPGTCCAIGPRAGPLKSGGEMCVALCRRRGRNTAGLEKNGSPRSYFDHVARTCRSSIRARIGRIRCFPSTYGCTWMPPSWRGMPVNLIAILIQLWTNARTALISLGSGNSLRGSIPRCLPKNAGLLRWSPQMAFGRR